MAAFPTDPNEELPKNEDHLNESSDDSNPAEHIQDSTNEGISDDFANFNSGVNPQENEVSDNDASVQASAIAETSQEEINDSEEFALPLGAYVESEPVVVKEPIVNKRYLLEFEGTGNDYFFIAFRGYVLTVLTLGLYYPWARVQRMRYMLNNLWLDGAPFVFEATGEEVFKGFIKVYAVLAALGGLYIYALVAQEILLQLWMPAIFTLFSLVITPLAIHGSLRYRCSKTSWKGIYFNYSGRLGPIYSLYIKNILLTIFTAGIYGSWAQVNLMSFLAENLRLGNVEFKYKGDGTKIFVRGFVTGLVSYGVGIVLTIFAGIFMVASGNIPTSASTSVTPDVGAIIGMAVVVYVLLLGAILIGFTNFKVWSMKYNLNATLFRLGNHLGRIEEQINIEALTRF
ncbi:MAG: YjgN family protein, partial [Flexibacteraceae bacterium]